MGTETLRAVPRLSLLDYLSKDETKKACLFEELKEYGFIILKDHPIDQSKVDRAYELNHKFFQLPIEQKEKYIANNGGGEVHTFQTRAC